MRDTTLSPSQNAKVMQTSLYRTEKSTKPKLDLQIYIQYELFICTTESILYIFAVHPNVSKEFISDSTLIVISLGNPAGSCRNRGRPRTANKD